MIQLFKGDCLEVMKSIPDKSIDAIITDPPYGTTACKWDSVIPFDLMWKQLNRIIKDNGAIVLFGSEPFSSALRISNIKNYKYDWIWQKNRGSNFATVKYMPMKEHEIISIFNKHNYYPIMQKRTGGGSDRIKYKINPSTSAEVYNGLVAKKSTMRTELRVPSSIQKFNTEVGKHPTQKPVQLIEYLVKTYTNENETVLDFTMGSGTTGVACKNLNRKFIGIEMDDKYFNIAENRINNHVVIKELF